ncbi:MAG: c-type cytochrome [Woeseiaceae bacterium]|jgi:cytochrome c553
MKIVASATTLFLAALFLAQPAIAEGDPEAGRELGYTCLGCHGIEGYRNAYPSYRVPKLGGQKAGYLVIALQGYRSGERSHPTMQAQATSLSDQQIEDVSAYLASLGAVATGGEEVTPPQAAAACAACHGPNGISVNAQWPTLAGQHESYILRALQQYRSGARANVIMGAQASLIAEEDVSVLARYYARLKGLETTKAE